MNYIKNMRIIGLKKFRDIIINFNKNMNIIIGENEAGKSTILEAIDIVINQLYKNADKSIIKDLINKENLIEFENEPTFENLPKIYIEIELELNDDTKNINYSGLEYIDSDKEIKTGIAFICEIDKEFENEITNFINNKKIPYEYYTMKWKTFAGDTYKSIQKPIKYLSINISNIEANNSFNYYNKSFFNNKYDPEIRTSIKSQYISKIESILEDIDEMEDIDEKRKFNINTKKVVLENIITIIENGISIENKGDGMENLIKTEIALKKSSNNDVISIEEPENHLSHTNLRQMIKNIETKQSDSQIIITTHNSLIVSNLDLKNVIFLNEDKIVSFNDLDDKTSKFFLKCDNNKIMDFILSTKVILVEGNSEYMLLPEFYKRLYGKNIEEDNIFVISIAGLGYKNYIEVAKKLNKKIAIITDNDQKDSKLFEVQTFNEENDKIKIFTDRDKNRWTLEACLYYDNEEKMKKIIKIDPKAEYKFHDKDYGKVLGKMLNNKTDIAYLLLDIDDIVIPSYIGETFEWIKD